MRSSTYEGLRALRGRFGAREFGKLTQKLLAVSFRAAGFAHVVERGVQGVDVDAADGCFRYATEVKTTVRRVVSFLRKDVAGLTARKADGYHPVLAVLRLGPLSNWIMADAEHLQPGTLALESLRPYRMPDLEDRVCVLFDGTLAAHLQPTLLRGQVHLDGVLRKLGIEQMDADAVRCPGEPPA